jgi:hypothetical protein
MIIIVLLIHTLYKSLQYTLSLLSLTEWVSEWITTDGQSVCINYYLTVTVFFSDVRRSGLSFVLVTWTASIQFSKFAAGPRQHSIYLSIFITHGEMVAQLYPQALGSLGTSGVPFPIPNIVGPWGFSLTLSFMLAI